MNNYDFITPEWIKEKIKASALKNSDLAEALSVSDSQISQWLGGTRKPSSATKAAIYYFFESRGFESVSNAETLKLSSGQFIAVKTSNRNQYFILWNHFDSQLVIHRSNSNDIKYADLNKYKYLSLNPENWLYNIVYRIDTADGTLKLYRIKKAELAKDFEIIFEN